MKVSTCIVCGERFIGESRYCSDKCRTENLRIEKRAQEILKRKPKRPKLETGLAKDNAKAREADMSYGRYKAGLVDDAEWKERLRKRFAKREDKDEKEYNTAEFLESKLD